MVRATNTAGMASITAQIPQERLAALERFAATLGVSTAQALRWAVLTYIDGPGEIPQPKRTDTTNPERR